MLTIKKEKKQSKILSMPITLYDYQQVAFNKTIKELLKYGRALIVMATGLGKTFTSARIVEFFITQHISKNAKVLFLCDKNYILKQGHKNYKKILGNQYTYANFFGKSRTSTPEDCNFVFVTFQSKPHKYFQPDHFDFIVVDESHHSKATTYDQVLNYFTPTYKLGMTATPDREDEKDIRQIFGKEVVNYTLAEAIAREWVTPIEYKILSDGIDDDILESLVNDVLAEKIRITEKQLNEKLFINMRTEVQVKHILQYTAERNLKAIVFCKNIAHMEHVANILPDCVSVHSEQGDTLNDFAIKQYESGLVRHILAVEMFNEGIDLPDTDVLVFLRGTDSYRIWAQQLGRGLRKYPDKDKVIVLDFVANIERIQNVRKLSIEIETFRKKSGKLDDLNTTPALHIEGNGYIFNFDEKLISVLSMLEYMVHVEKYETWQEASEAAIVLGIKSGVEYEKGAYRKDLKLPSDPRDYYKDFPGFPIFLGQNFFKTWQEAAKFCKKHKINSITKYKDSRTENIFDKLPPNPSVFYKDFPGWNIFFKKPQPPKGWNTLNYFSDILKLGNIQQIKVFIELFRKDNPNWFNKYVSTNGNIVEYFHKDLGEKIKQEFLNRVITKDWPFLNSFCKKNNIPRKNFKKYIDSLGKEKKKNNIVSVSMGKSMRLKINPSILNGLENMFNYPDSKMIPLDDTALNFNCSIPTLKLYIEENFGKNELKTFLLPRKRIYFNKTILVRLKKNFSHKKDIQEPPPGWITFRSIRNSRIKSSDPKIISYIDKFRKTKKSWFQKFKIKNGNICEHYHPDLVQKIRDHFSKKTE